ncbi:ester cyclase [Flavobacterium suzhouense]|uniref:Ester cyclase n=1 Tax=Flavobacterium suzhouense TaxID=1529638 RepID=A0ABW5NWD9_9FLAO
MINETNAAVIQGLYAAVNQRDFEYLNTLCDAESEWFDIPFDKMAFGVTSVSMAWHNRFAIFPDISCEIKNLIAHDNYVIVQGVERGTHEGIFTIYEEEAEPTGLYVEVGFCDVYYMNDGKIMKANSNLDVYALFTQIYGDCVA